MRNQVISKKSKVKIKSGLGSYFVFLFFTFGIIYVQPAAAQDEHIDTAPPPLKVISKEERQKIEAQKNLKDRISVSLQLMNERLSTAERSAETADFDGMFRELGVFHALVDESISFLEKLDKNNKNVLETLKKLEIRLRTFMPRLETIRRELPMQYEEYVRLLMKFVREARSRAIEPMFSDGVVKTKTK